MVLYEFYSQVKLAIAQIFHRIKLSIFYDLQIKWLLLKAYLFVKAIIKNPIKRQLNDHFSRLFK